MLIINGTVHTMEGLTIPGGYVDIRGDKIAGTGPMEECPKSWEGRSLTLKADTSSRLVDATATGMFGTPPASRGRRQRGHRPCTPTCGHRRSEPMDRCFRDARLAGVTTVLTGPGSANPISGQFVAMKTAGRWLDDMVIKPRRP